jgi:hypothetical protein
MKKFLLNIWYTLLYQFDQHRNEIPDWWYIQQPFDKLPKNLQKIFIAKDVIAQIRIGRIKPARDGYINLPFGGVGDNRSVKDHFDELNGCTVCGLGACLISTIKYKNTLTFDDLTDAFSTSNRIKSLLLSVFSLRETALIEACFEQGDHQFADKQNYQMDYDEWWRCKDFFNRYRKSYDRLTAIMQNIIDNNGEIKI